MATDYDAPRTSTIDLGELGLEELQAAARRPRMPIDFEAVELDVDVDLPPDSMLADDELTALVVPIKSDELRCDRCFLVRHYRQFANRTDNAKICSECC
jgi:hypothetical protein